MAADSRTVIHDGMSLNKFFTFVEEELKFCIPLTYFKAIAKFCVTGLRCGSVGRAVTSNTRGPRFESNNGKVLSTDCN